MEVSNILTAIIILITVASNIQIRKNNKLKDEMIRNRTATEMEIKLDNAILILNELKNKDDIQTNEISILKGEINTIKFFLDIH